MKHLTKIFSVLAFSLLSTTAFAQDALRFEVNNNHPVDQPAQVRVTANVSLRNVDVVITNCAPTVIQRHFDAMKSGEAQTIAWPQKEGKFNCGIRINATTGMGAPLEARGNYTFVSGASTAVPLRLDVDLSEIKSLTPETDHVLLRASRPFTVASITVKAEDGSVIDSVERAVGNLSDYRLSWKPNGQRPILLEIKVQDNNNSWASSTIMSFMVPHTDVVFDTNKYNIREDQVGFLKEPLDIILEKVHKFDKVAVNLYVTGYTDTVGSAKDNDKLSLNRARSIAQWFRKHGLSIPTYYRGAGERDLAVQTPDNTPNEANRRAVYILSNSAPIDGLGSWNVLK